MNVVELQRALRQLRCSGIAAGLELRLLETQTEKLAPIGFLSRLSRTNCSAAKIASWSAG
jgi:hypothetical protein